jgi:DNA repair exonuclease SbcCD ATPase subunit
MSDLSTISIMFEELKQSLKRIEASKEQPEGNKPEDGITVSDLNEINNRMDESEEVVLSELRQIKQTLAEPQKVLHRISIDITSSWVFIALTGLGLMLLISLFFHYQQRETISSLEDNDLKYRYIRAFNQADSINIYRLEDIFDYNRNPKAIKDIRESVKKYEKDLAEKAKRMEQARLKEQEAQKLQEEAEKLKSN